MSNKLNSNKEKILYRDESKCHRIPKFFPIIMPIEIVTGLFLLIYSLIGIFTSDEIISSHLVLLASALVIFAHGLFCDIYYDWQECARYVLDSKGNLRFVYNLSDTVTSNSVTIKFKEVKGYKLKGKNIILRGTFLKKSPLQKEKELKKIVIPIDFAENDKVIILGAIETLVRKG